MKYLKKIFEKNNNEYKVDKESLFPKNAEYNRNANAVPELIGEVVTNIEISKGSTELLFQCESGANFIMYHEQDCYESVYLYDIIGDLDDLIGSTILRASEDCNVSDPKGVEVDYYEDSHTWTFYNFATMKGYVTLRWLGQSNGYYGEGVTFLKFSYEDEN